MRFPKLKLPLRTTLLYLLFGGLWILLSDQILAIFVANQAQQAAYQTLKGWFFILVSGFLLYILLNRDFTDRKQSEDALRESEERFSKAFYQSPIGIILIDMTDNTIREVNDTIVEMLGLPREQIVRQNDRQLGLQIDPEVYEIIGRELSEHGMFRNKEIQVRLPNGETRHVLNSGALIAIQGKPYNLALLQDVTEHKQAEKALRASEQRYRLIAQNAEDMIWTMNLEFQLTYVSPMVERALGYSAEEILASTPERFLTANSYAVGLNVFREEIENAQPQPDPNYARLLELEYRRKNGSTFWVETKFSLFRDSDGHPTAVLGVGRDITERKQVEENLRQSEENFSKAFRSSPIALMITRLADGSFLELNEAYIKLVGYERAELIGHLPTELNIYINSDEHKEIVAQLLKSGTLHNYETRIRNKSGELRTVIGSLELIEFSGEACILSTLLDITERKRAEEEILSLSRFANENPSPVIRVAQDGMILYANSASEDILKTWKREVGQQVTEEWHAYVNQALESGKKTDVEIESSGKHYSCILSPVQSAGYINVYCYNITERKQAEEALRNSQAQITGIFNSAMDAIISADADQNVLIFNPAAEAMFRCNQSEAIGQPLERFIPPRFRASHSQHVKDFARGGATSRVMGHLGTIYGLRNDGEEFPIEASISKINMAGRDLFTVILRDSTERKQAEEQIQRQLKHLNALRMIDIAISSSFDLDIILEVVLQQVLSQLGVDASAVILFNPRLQMIEYAASRGFRSAALNDTKLRLGEGYASQAVLKRKTIHISALMETGSKLAKTLESANENFVEYYGAPLIVKGEVKGVLEIYHRSYLKADAAWLEFLEALAGQAAIAIDNAQLFETLQRSNLNLEQRVVERTAELNQTNTELERANRIKDEFLANMSHELRTPLTSILGLSESLLEQRRDPLSDYQEKSLEIIESSGRHLLELINDILDLSKIEAGKFDYYPQPISVDEICRSSLSFVKSQAAKKSITVTYLQDASISKIFADPRRLKQILVNLLSNAVKFTLERGEVILQIQADLEQDLIKFSVIDNGIGIGVQDLQRLFQPFVQVDSGLNRQHEGTGLGLALVQKLTDLHGGSVQVESEVGKGSRFTVNLPCLQEEVTKLEKLETHPAPPISVRDENAQVVVEAPAHLGVILLADDNMHSILTVGEYLESHGYKVVVAHDGSEALKQAEAIYPDLILMDIQMPVMNGLEVIARLRGNVRFADTPIIALTALAMPGDRERSLLAGANEYMSKPASLKTLKQTIGDLLRVRSNN